MAQFVKKAGCHTVNVGEFMEELGDKYINTDGKVVLNYATAVKLIQFVYDKTNESFVECEGKELQIGLPTGMFGMILKMVLKTIGLEIKFTDKVSDKAS
jgi:hypothetical protein